MQNKRDILSEKRESGMALKKREFTPEAVMLTPMLLHSLMTLNATIN